MTPLAKLSRGVLERLAGVFYEGPEPPTRLARMVVLFARAHPRATRRTWADFAADHAAESYRSGYVRGFEEAERRWGRPGPSPEELADQRDPGWRNSPAVDLSDPDAVVFEVDDAVVVRHKG